MWLGYETTKRICIFNQKIFIRVVLVTVVLFCRTTFQRKHVQQILWMSLREVSIVGLLISTPTQQICKPVIENFYLFSIVILIFLKPCINKVFIHSFIHSSIWTGPKFAATKFIVEVEGYTPSLMTTVKSLTCPIVGCKKRSRKKNTSDLPPVYPESSVPNTRIVFFILLPL